MNEPQNRAHRTELRWLYFVLIVSLIFFVLALARGNSALNIVAQVFYMLTIIVGTFRAMQLKNEVEQPPKGEIETPQGRFNFLNLLITGLFALAILFLFLDSVIESGGISLF